MTTQSKPEFVEMNKRLMDRIRSLLVFWLPGGYFNENVYITKNTRDEKGQELVVNMKTGIWKEKDSQPSPKGDAVIYATGTLFELYAHLFFYGSQEKAFQQLKQDYLSKTGTFIPFVLTPPNFSINEKVEQKSDSSPWKQVTPIPKGATPPLNKKTQHWIYRDEGGRRLFYVLKMDDKRHIMTYWTNEKTTEFEWRTDSQLGLSGSIPFYNSGKISSSKVVIVAGNEEEADAAAELFGGVATTSFGGVGKINSSKWNLLFGKEIMIWENNNDLGKRYTNAVVDKLWGHANIKILRFVEDHGPEWGPVRALKEEWKPEFGANCYVEYPKVSALNQLPGVVHEKHDFFETCGLSLRDLIKMDLPPLEYIVDELITTDSLNLVSARRGVGKSLFVMELALSLSRGRRFFVWDVPQPCTTVVVDGEMGLTQLKNNYQSRFPKGKSSLYLVTTDSFVKADRLLNIVDHEIQNGLERFFDKVKAKVIIFDNLSSLCCGIDENSNMDQERYLIWFRKLRVKGFVVIFVDHQGKAGNGPRGASKKEDWLSTSIELAPIGKNPQAKFTIKLTKFRGKRPSIEDVMVKLNSDTIPTKWEIIDKKTSSSSQQKVFPSQLLGVFLKGDPTQGELQKRFGVNQSTISRSLQRLRENNWLTKNNEVTTEGKKYLQEILSKKRLSNS